MSSKAIKFFYKNVIESSLDEEFAATSMVHEHYLLPKRIGGSSVKLKANEDRDRVGGHTGLI
jgi:hypothetical protein